MTEALFLAFAVTTLLIGYMAGCADAGRRRR